MWEHIIVMLAFALVCACFGLYFLIKVEDSVAARQRLEAERDTLNEEAPDNVPLSDVR